MIGETMLLAVAAKAFGTIRHTFRPASQAKPGGIMNTGSSKSLDSGAWRKLYTAVLFEVDKTKLPERIAQAEKALALRARELFYAAGDSTAEEELMTGA
jgi:hypothetical protein